MPQWHNINVTSQAFMGNTCHLGARDISVKLLHFHGCIFTMEKGRIICSHLQGESINPEMSEVSLVCPYDFSLVPEVKISVSA